MAQVWLVAKYAPRAVPVVRVTWRYPLYGSWWYDWATGGGEAWKHWSFCSEDGCIKLAGHSRGHNDGMGRTWLPLTDEEWQDYAAEVASKGFR